MLCFVSLFLVVSTNAIDILARRIFEMTYYVSSGKLNHSILLVMYAVVKPYTLTHSSPYLLYFSPVTWKVTLVPVYSGRLTACDSAWVV